MNWIKVNEEIIKKCLGIPVLGYNPEWVNEDFNPKGVRECFASDGGEDGWISAKWDSDSDCYNTDYISVPTHVILITATPDKQINR